MKFNTLIPVVASVIAVAIATENSNQFTYHPRLEIHFEGTDTPTPAQMQDGLDRMPQPTGDSQFSPQMSDSPSSQAKVDTYDGVNRTPQHAGDGDFHPITPEDPACQARKRVIKVMEHTSHNFGNGRHPQKNAFPQRAQGGTTSVHDGLQNSDPNDDGVPSQHMQNSVTNSANGLPYPVGQGESLDPVNEIPPPAGNGDTLDRMPEPIGDKEFPIDDEFPPYPANRIPEPVGNGNSPAKHMPEPLGDEEPLGDVECRDDRMEPPNMGGCILYPVYRTTPVDSDDFSPMPQPVGDAQFPPQPLRIRRSRIHAARQQGDECGLLFVQASDNAYSGYISEQRDENGRYTVVADKSQAVATKFHDHSIVPNLFTGYDVLGATFGAVQDEQEETGDEQFRGNSKNFAMLTGTSRTAYGEGSSYGRSSFNDATGAEQRIESAIFNMGENGEIYPFWVDSDGTTTPSVWGVNAERQIIYSANIGQYNSAFGGYSARLFCQPLF